MTTFEPTAAPDPLPARDEARSYAPPPSRATGRAGADAVAASAGAFAHAALARAPSRLVPARWRSAGDDPRAELTPARRRRRVVLAVGSVLVFAASLAVFLLFKQETFYTQFEDDPYTFRSTYPSFYADGHWVAYHHHLHYLAWCALYALSGRVVAAMEAVSLIPAALGCAVLWFGLVRERRVSASTAFLVTGLVAGSATFFFYATTLEVHAMQACVAIVAGVIALRGRRARTASRRLMATGLAAALLLAAHPLHVMFMPFLVLLHAGRMGPPDSARVPGAPRFLVRAIQRETLAAAALLLALAGARMLEVHLHMDWSVGTLTYLADRDDPDPVEVELWRSFLRPHLWLLPFVGLFLARGERGRFSPKVRAVLVAAWCVPILALVIWIRLFENGAYFIALAPLFVLLLGGDGLRALDARVSATSRLARALALPPLIAAGAWVAGTPQMIARFNPPLAPDERALVDGLREVTGREDLVCAFDDRVIDLVRMRAHRVTSPFSSGDALYLGVRAEEYDVMVRAYVDHLSGYLAQGGTLWLVLAERNGEYAPPITLLMETAIVGAVEANVDPERREYGRHVLVGPIRMGE